MTHDEAIKRVEPPQNVIADAIRQAKLSPCRSKRGVAVFQGDTVFVSACNHQVPPRVCDGSPACKATCNQTAIHAEQACLIGSSRLLRGFDMLHVKVVDGALVPSGGPSCVQCSKLMVAAGIAGMWLYHAEGWRRYPIDEFHQQSVEFLLRGSGVSSMRKDDQGAPLLPGDQPRFACQQRGAAGLFRLLALAKRVEVCEAQILALAIPIATRDS